MKITCEREPLLSAFQTAAMVAPTRSPKPILQRVKLEVTPDSAVMMATDMDTGIRLEVSGIEVDSPGAAVLPVDRFGLILRESSDEKLRLESVEAGIVVKGERSEFKVPSENPDEFPRVVSFGETKYHTLPSKLMRELIRRTIFATDTESSRYALGGVLLEFEADRVTAVGTDGRRLSKMEGAAQSVEGHLSGDTMTIVPTRSMQLLERSLSDDDSEIRIAARANDVLIQSSRATIYSRLVEGRFPKWREVFPQRRDAQRIDIVVGPIYSALRQAAIMTNADSRGIDFHFKNGNLTMVASTADRGESHVELPIAYEGPDVVVTMDHRYVADFLRVLDPDRTFTLEIEDADSPALFTTDDGFGYVVMPLARERGRG